MLFRTVPSPTHYGLLFPEISGSQTPPKTSVAIISGTGKATNFKFCRRIDRIDWNKRPLKILGKVAVGILRDRLIFSSSRFDHISPLLCQLHWLKASERVTYKVAVLADQHGLVPS